MATRPYLGRFAPSPTGPLHAGSLVAALGSWLDARAHQGQWWVRIEDVDTPRVIAGADHVILAQLARCGLVPDAPPMWQSTQGARYAGALQHLVAAGLAYPCTCSRKAIEQALLAQGGWQATRHGERPYPGTCRGRPAPAGPSAWRLRTDGPDQCNTTIRWQDRRLGAQHQALTEHVGDFVLRRADGLWAYQLAVVVDDASQGVTDVVRGEDLADNTPRQIHLQTCLGLQTPRYLHLPLVLAEDGQKLSKQNGAQPLELTHPLAALQRAAHALGLPAALTGEPRAAARPPTAVLSDWLAAATSAWADRHPLGR